MPKAPWWGGVFERLIRSVKRCLKKTIGQAKLTQDELLTAVVEVESVLNSRRLSYLTSDDLDQPLTPSHLLYGRRLLNMPDCNDPDEADEDYNAGPEVLTRRITYLDRTLNNFWTRWQKEYLLEQREAHRHHNGKASPSKVNVRDIVVVHSEKLPRSLWKLGKIERVIPGRDGLIRGALIRVAKRGREATHLSRAISLLYPLETVIGTTTNDSPTGDEDTATDQNSSQVSDTVVTQDTTSKDNESPPHKRPSRRAAFEARDRTISQALSED